MDNNARAALPDFCETRPKDKTLSKREREKKTGTGVMNHQAEAKNGFNEQLWQG